MSETDRPGVDQRGLTDADRDRLATLAREDARITNGGRPLSRTTRTCAHCGRAFAVWRFETDRRYCGLPCRAFGATEGSDA